MNRLQLIPIPYLILISGVAILLIVTVFYFLGWSRGGNEVQAEWDKAKTKQLDVAIAAERANRDKEQSMEQKLNEAQNAAIARENALHADYVAAHTAVLGLRDTVTTLRGQLSSAPLEACRVTADLALKVFGDCTDQYREVAEAADRHASDARTLSDAWPR